MCNRPLTQPPVGARQRGLSVIELMVGIVVALLVGLAATNSAVMFTASQRAGIGAGGVAVNSATVLSALKDDVAVAGLGFFGDSRFLCNTLNLSVNATLTSNGATFSPLQVTRTAASDTIDVVYATRVESGANVRLAALAGTTATLSSYLPVAVNQAVLLAPNLPSNATPCVVRTVTANAPPTLDADQVLSFGVAGKHNAVAFTTNTPFDGESRLTQLGDLRWNRYRVDNGNLIMERPLDGASAIIARNVISFRMQYGVTAAAAGSTTLETWVDPTAAFATISAANLPRIRALRIGLIVRSPQIERVNPSTGLCDATTTKPALFGLAPENLSNADWGCYRYRTSTVVVPMRNIVLGLR